MTWQQRFDEQFADLEYISDTPDAETRLKSFISSLLEGLINEIPDKVETDAINPTTFFQGDNRRLKQQLKDKYGIK